MKLEKAGVLQKRYPQTFVTTRMKTLVLESPVTSSPVMKLHAIGLQLLKRDMIIISIIFRNPTRMVISKTTKIKACKLPMFCINYLSQQAR